jgi:hypothetical protein
MTWLRAEGRIRREITIPADGDYDFWIRKFWNPQGFRWRIGTNSEWRISRDLTLTDLIELGDPGRRVGWGLWGSARLSRGTHVFELEPLPGETRVTAYDCFVVTQDPFHPRGASKPGAPIDDLPPGWFAFEPPGDEAPGSLLDLRELNETEAGSAGFIRARGEELIRGSSEEPIRFWGLNVGMQVVAGSPREHERLARSFAKRGVNLVRIHGPIYTGEGPEFGRVNTNRVHQIQRFVRALKKEGIYSALSIYFPLWVRLGPENSQFPGYTGGRPFALLYFNEDFQKIYRTWWRALLTLKDPETGRALKDEPAVALAEMVNEDSTLFWTFNPQDRARSNIPEPLLREWEARFGAWLREWYPGETLEEIRNRRWGGKTADGDDFEQGRVGFRGLWEIVNERTARDQDTARFLTEVMGDFYEETRDYLKGELGFQGLVCASNWRTASGRYLDPLDKHANLAGDVLDRHGYFEGLHEGRNAAWNVETGQTFDDRSALRLRSADGARFDAANPLFDVSYTSRPSLISEVNWPLPNRLRADMIPMGACYGALHGTDGIFWFGAGLHPWDAIPGKFSTQTPVVLGQFPAAALIYRKGWIRTGPRVVEVSLGVDDLFALRGTPAVAAASLDNLRRADVPGQAGAPADSTMPALASLVGRVCVDFAGSTTIRQDTAMLAAGIRNSEQRARSATEELEWDWGRGLLRIEAARAQGVAGFLSEAGRVALPDFAVESGMEYGSIVVVSLDGKPLRESARFLVQAASEERPYRWETSVESGKRELRNRGGSPLLVREFEGVLRVTRPDAGALRWTALDYGGYPEGESFEPGSVVTLRARTPYYLVERQEAARAQPTRGVFF